MGRFSNVLLASDFDHTLTDMSGQIPARNLEAIAAFQAEGGHFHRGQRPEHSDVPQEGRARAGECAVHSL